MADTKARAKPARESDVRDPRQPEPGEPGSIEQQLDMLETGDLRGDEILHHHGRVPAPYPSLESDDELLTNYNFDMSEANREGDELAGDEHSSGLQGEDPEFEKKPNEESENSAIPIRRRKLA